MSKISATVVLGCAAMLAVTGLVLTGHCDAAELGVVATLAAQLLNLVWSAHIEVKVNGNLTKLINAKTIPDLVSGVESVIQHNITITSDGNASETPTDIPDGK